MRRPLLIFLLCLICRPTSAQLQEPRFEYDLLLKGGQVIDPKSNLSARRDVAIAQGKIAAVAPVIPAAKAYKVIDVTGYYLTPGLIDIHAHFFGTPATCASSKKADATRRATPANSGIWKCWSS